VALSGERHPGHGQREKGKRQPLQDQARGRYEHHQSYVGRYQKGRRGNRSRRGDVRERDISTHDGK
jgi:hypothetical protein